MEGYQSGGPINEQQVRVADFRVTSRNLDDEKRRLVYEAVDQTSKNLEQIGASLEPASQAELKKKLAKKSHEELQEMIGTDAQT